MSRAIDAIAAALAALREERDRIDRAIAGLEQLASPGAPPPAPWVPPADAAPRAAAPPQVEAKNRKSEPPRRPGKLAGRVAEVRKLWDAGLTLDAIAAKVGCSAEAIRLMAKAHRWERPPAAAVTRLAPGVSRRPADEA